MTEKLTEKDRAQAAAVQALTKQVAKRGQFNEARWAAKCAELSEARAEVTRLTEQVVQLTVELDDARVECAKHRQMSITARMLLAEDQQLESENARLTEQVAQAWAEVSRVQQVGLRAESEVARLTEALAAAEQQLESFGESTMRLLARAEAAELARDAANALLRHVRPGDLPSHLRPALRAYVDAHLSGQPAAPARTEAEARAEAAESRVTELTEALAAAESQRDKRSEEAENEFNRAESVERDRDAACAENARLTEQVAQLTAERDELREHRDTFLSGHVASLQSENARLTANLARAEAAERDRNAANALLVRVLRCSDPDEEIPFEDIQDHLSFGESTMRLLARAEAAERDRDAANALLDALRNELETQRVTAFGEAVAVVEAFSRIVTRQPAAPKDRLTQAVRCTACQKRQCDGTHVGCPSYLLDETAAPVPERRVYGGEGFPDVIESAAPLRCSPDPFGGCRVHGQSAAPTSYGTVPSPTAAEVELAALRERVAEAQEWLEGCVYTAPRRALEVLRGR